MSMGGSATNTRGCRRASYETIILVCCHSQTIRVSLDCHRLIICSPRRWVGGVGGIGGLWWCIVSCNYSYSLLDPQS